MTPETKRYLRGVAIGVLLGMLLTVAAVLAIIAVALLTRRQPTDLEQMLLSYSLGITGMYVWEMRGRWWWWKRRHLSFLAGGAPQ